MNADRVVTKYKDVDSQDKDELCAFLAGSVASLTAHARDSVGYCREPSDEVRNRRA
jgi:hypothetical protein